MKFSKFCLILILIFPSSVLAICFDSIQETTPTSRFIINGSEAYDTKTGLTWKRCPVMEPPYSKDVYTNPYAGGEYRTIVWSEEKCHYIYKDTSERSHSLHIGPNQGLYNWQEALTAPESNIGEGWRLPNVKELSSITEFSCEYPSINTEVFLHFREITDSHISSSNGLMVNLWRGGKTHEPMFINSEGIVRLVKDSY